MGQKERDDTNAGAASAKVVPLWPTSIRKDLPTGYLEQVARRVRANLTDLVATADTYNLDLATEFRIAADLLQKPSGTSHRLQVAESARLRLSNGTSGCWELVDQNGTVLGLIVAIDGRLVLAPTSWSRREVLAAGGAVLLAPLAGLAARAAMASGADTSPLPDPEAAARLDYVMQHPRSVDVAAALSYASERSPLPSSTTSPPRPRWFLQPESASAKSPSFASRPPMGRSCANCRSLRRSWPRSWASSSGMHPSDGTTPLPSATTTRRSPPPTARARRRARRMRACGRATSRCTANTSRKQGCG